MASSLNRKANRLDSSVNPYVPEEMIWPPQVVRRAGRRWAARAATCGSGGGSCPASCGTTYAPRRRRKLRSVCFQIERLFETAFCFPGSFFCFLSLVLHDQKSISSNDEISMPPPAFLPRMCWRLTTVGGRRTATICGPSGTWGRGSRLAIMWRRSPGA